MAPNGKSSLPGFFLHPVTVNNVFAIISGCGCNRLGSVRTDCDQATGRCVCKPGIEGLKCDTCPDGQGLSSRGCNGRE